MGTTNVGQLQEGGTSVGSSWEPWKGTQMVCGGKEKPGVARHSSTCLHSQHLGSEVKEFKVILSYKASSRSAWVTHPVSKNVLCVCSFGVFFRSPPTPPLLPETEFLSVALAVFHRPGWPQTRGDPPASASRGLRLKAWVACALPIKVLLLLLSLLFCFV